MKRIIKAILLLTLTFGSAVWLDHASAEPAQQGANLLNNPGFEQPFVDGRADGWSGWHIVTEKQDEECLSGYHFQPKWNLETNGDHVNEGVTSQYIGNNWDTWGGGVSQTVSVTPGQTYRFTFFGKGRVSNDPSPQPSEFGINMNMRAGIDPNGSGASGDGDIVWSAAQSPHDSWQQLAVEATATGDKITVFTSADLGVPGTNQCRQFIDTWYDNAQLVQVGAAPTNTPPPAPPATTPPQPTAPPLPSPTSEIVPTEGPTEPPVDTPAPTPEEPQAPDMAGTGTICVNAFHDENGNGIRESSEGYMAGVTFTVANQVEIVGQAVSEGMPDPKCFEGLAPGPYQVAQQVPDRLEMTTAGNAAVPVAEGMTIGLEFGSRLRQDEAAGSSPEGGDEANGGESGSSGETEGDGSDGGFDIASFSGLGVILLGVLLLGGLLFLILRR